MRLDQEPQYRGPIKDDVDNQPRAHRHAPRRVPRTDYDVHDRGEPSLVTFWTLSAIRIICVECLFLQLDEQAATLKQTNVILRTLSATINEMRLDQEPQYRGPIKDDVDNQPRAHRHAPRRVPRTDYDVHDRGEPDAIRLGDVSQVVNVSDR
ncbi:hypothetical protein GOBAR_DD29949 [Gossypium barbadense]|nr:hypothetical protein GOBAR_DD29949 [Gossypium barbadense]